MADLLPPHHASTVNDAVSDYGSDLSAGEEELLNQLLSGNDASLLQPVDVEDGPLLDDDAVEYDVAPQTLRLPRVSGKWPPRPATTTVEGDGSESAARIVTSLPFDPGYPDLSQALARPRSREASVENPRPGVTEDDTSPPLQRFRGQGRKALSVTDIVSPAWCELQYFYTMKYHGRKKRTAAMKRGSEVHKDLEEQVHTTVQVQIDTKEDAWGLRIWNVIQGLRTLQETGHTRELEIWGTVHDQVINGVIDEVSFTCPDPDLEAELQQKDKTKKPSQPPPNQSIISEYFKSTGSASLSQTLPSNPRKAYICDVKTRAGQTLPSGAAFRPTQYQLLLYHYLLGRLATNQVDFSILTSRYGLKADASFSDSFIAQIGSLNDEVFYDAPSDPLSSTPSSSQDSTSILLAHNSLATLWSYMIATFQCVLPYGPASLGPLLKAEYRSRDDGLVMGCKVFPMDRGILERYLDYEMQWWKGEREPVGVVVEEAFKCRSCDFAEKCEWRLSRIEEAKERARMVKAEQKPKPKPKSKSKSSQVDDEDEG